MLLRGLGTGSTLLVSLLTAWLLSGAELGGYLLAISIAALGQLVAQGGIGTATTRWLIDGMGDGRPSSLRPRLAILLCTVAATGTAGGLLVWLLGPVLATHVVRSEALVPLVPLMALLVPVAAISAVIGEATRAVGRPIIAVLATGVVSSALLAVGMWIAHASGMRIGAAGLLAASSLLGMGNILAMLVAIHRVLPPATATTSAGADGGPTFLALLRTCLPNWGAGLLYYAMTGADLWIVSHHADDATTGRYGFALRIAAALMIPATLSHQTIGPTVAAALRDGDPMRASRLIQRTGRLLVVVLGVSYSMLLVAWWLLGDRLLGDTSQLAWSVFAIIGAGQLASVAIGPGGLVLAWDGQLRRTLPAYAVAALAVPCIVAAFFPTLQLQGTAACFVAGLLATRVWNQVLARRHVGVQVAAWRWTGPN